MGYRFIVGKLASVLHPSHRLIQVRFPGTHRMKQDAQGRWMALDIDGMGRVFASQGAEVEGIDSQGWFAEYVTVRADFGWSGSIDVLLGPEPNLGDAVPLDGDFRGAGWLVQGVARLDGQAATTIANGLPAPFFASAQGQGQIVIESASVKRITGFGIKDFPGQAQNMSAVQPLLAKDEDGNEVTYDLAYSLNALKFELQTPPEASGILIWRRSDRFHGGQQCRVLVNKECVGHWNEPIEDRTYRWGWGRFGFDARRWSGQTIELSLDPPSGVPLWTSSWYEIDAFFGDLS